MASTAVILHTYSMSKYAILWIIKRMHFFDNLLTLNLGCEHLNYKYMSG